MTQETIGALLALATAFTALTDALAKAGVLESEQVRLRLEKALAASPDIPVECSAACDKALNFLITMIDGTETKTSQPDWFH